MELKKFSGFNEFGYMPQGIYEMTFDEFEEIFCRNTSKRRQEIMRQYKPYLEELRSSKYFLNHWIDGSFTTLKKDPSDIDLLTEFDGVKIDLDNKMEEINRLIFDAPLKTNNMCHSLVIYRYPDSDAEKYEEYMFAKTRFLTLLFYTDKNYIPKGFVQLVN